MYVDYEYYTSGYLLGKKPTVPEGEFCFWEKQARGVIDMHTFGRLTSDPSLVSDKVKDCACAIAELFYRANSVSEQALSEGAPGPLASYSNDGESGSFDLRESIYTESGKKAEARRLVYQYLGNSGLLYSGLHTVVR